MKRRDDANGSQVSRERDPQQAAQGRDSARKAGSLILALPHHQREVIRLKVEGGLSDR